MIGKKGTQPPSSTASLDNEPYRLSQRHTGVSRALPLPPFLRRAGGFSPITEQKPVPEAALGSALAAKSVHYLPSDQYEATRRCRFIGQAGLSLLAMPSLGGQGEYPGQCRQLK